MSTGNARLPYRDLAAVYDQLFGGPRARVWQRIRWRLLRRILPQVRTACDLGCGTGSPALEFARRGLKVFAVDRSPAMCRIARQKARDAGLPLRVIRADLRRFRLPEPVDLVTSEFTVLNHLPRKADLAPALAAVRHVLRPGGFF